MMIRHTDDMHVEDRQHMRDGAGTVTVKDMLNADEFFGKGRLFSQITIPPGASIGQHQHVDESEFYYLVSGHGVYTVDGTQCEVGPGDLAIVPDGGTHGIRNTGDEPLVMVALILFTGSDAA